MKCPFPGMDPYLEQPAIWPDFHDGLVFCVREQLQPALAPKYAALTQDRLYVVEHQRPIRPDVSIVETRRPEIRDQGGVATAAEPEIADPLAFELVTEEIRQPLLHIVEPAAGGRVVTAIEILSPDNKTPGPGRDSYRQKCSELIAAGASLVEIDLLTRGESILAVDPEQLSSREPWHYLVQVRRAEPARIECYPFSARDSLPAIGIPLAGADPDVGLELEKAFRRCWETGPYAALIDYTGPPAADLPAADAAWARERAKPAKQGK